MSSYEVIHGSKIMEWDEEAGRHLSVYVKEASSLPEFADRPIDEQIEVLKVEMMNWATGRSYYYHNESYHRRSELTDASNSYSLYKIQSKAVLVETLLKLKEI